MYLGHLVRACGCHQKSCSVSLGDGAEKPHRERLWHIMYVGATPQSQRTSVEVEPCLRAKLELMMSSPKTHRLVFW